LKRNGEKLLYPITKIYTFKGLNKIEVKEAYAGDIVSLAGIEKINVGETVTDRDNPKFLPIIDIDAPTLTMTFMVNDSPFSGREGRYVTYRNVWDRLQKELRTNVSLEVEKSNSFGAFTIKGRGELQLAILIENMRREGYELQVSRPEVIYRDLDGHRAEPIKLAVVDVPDEFVGVVIKKLGLRKGEMINMVQGNDGYTRLEFKVPSRGLIGFRNEFMTSTKGTGTISHSFYEYEFYKGDIPRRNRGVIVAMKRGTSVAYALDNLQARGVSFIGPGVEIYEGMIVGEHNKENDIVVNVCKTKKLTNTRAAGSDDAVRLTPPRKFSLEHALGYIEKDELLEITPKNIRMRKKVLNYKYRKRVARG